MLTVDYKNLFFQKKRFAHLHECPHLNSMNVLHDWLVTKHPCTESGRDSTVTIQIMTIVLGGCVRDLIKAKNAIARFPQVRKCVLLPSCSWWHIVKHRRNWHFFRITQNSSFSKQLLKVCCVPQKWVGTSMKQFLPSGSRVEGKVRLSHLQDPESDD